MSTRKRENVRTKRRANRVRARVKQMKGRHRLTVFRSLTHVYAQVIDDVRHATVASCSSKQLKSDGDKTTCAKAVGTELAKRAKESGVETVVFDRGAYRYHGRVRALAEGVREGGIRI